MPTSKLTAAVLFIIEDSDEDFDTVEQALKQSGVAADLRRAVTARDGVSLFQKVALCRSVVVLIVLNNPATDGRQALVAIKPDPALKVIPVVVLSTSANPKDVAFCYSAGANAYHIKPVRHSDHLTVLVQSLTYWLSRAVLPTDEGDHP